MHAHAQIGRGALSAKLPPERLHSPLEIGLYSLNLLTVKGKTLFFYEQL